MSFVSHINMSMITDDMRDKWRNLIGDFMLDFGEIEYISYSLWSQKYNTGLPPHNFTKRTRQVISKLCSRSDKDTISLLNRAIHLAKKRNTIAHNPLHLHVFEHKETKELYPEFLISSYLQKECIDDFELIELKAEATDIMTQLYLSLGYLPSEKNG